MTLTEKDILYLSQDGEYDHYLDCYYGKGADEFTVYKPLAVVPALKIANELMKIIGVDDIIVDDFMTGVYLTSKERSILKIIQTLRVAGMKK